MASRAQGAGHGLSEPILRACNRKVLPDATRPLMTRAPVGGDLSSNPESWGP